MFSKTKISQKMTLVILFFLSWLCLSPSMSWGFDITHILGQHPELSTFSNYLTQTNLAQEINSRQTITVLAVANSDMGPLAGKPMDQIKKILSVHVFLDYYDMNKLKSIQGNPLTVTTLLQASGQALSMNNQGFINVTASGESIGFGSAAIGVARQTQAQLVKSVESDPYSISVLQISSPIIPSGINGGGSTTPQKSPTQAPTQPPTQSPPQADHVPTQSPKQDEHHAPTQSPKQDEHHAPTQSPISQPPIVSPPSDQSSSNSPSPTQSPPSDSSTPGSSQQENAPSPSGNAPSPSDQEAPQSSEVDAPSNDDNSPNGDSPSSSPSPTDNSPTMALGSEAPADVPATAADEGKKKKNAAGGMIAPYTVVGWICTIILSLILGNQV